MLIVSCQYRVHIKCNKINNKTYENVKRSGESQFCIIYNEEIFPFQKLIEQQFYITSKFGLKNDRDLSVVNNFPIERLKLFIKEINDISMNTKDQEDNFEEVNCNYIDIGSFYHKTDKNKLALFHLNIDSVSAETERRIRNNFEYD